MNRKAITAALLTISACLYFAVDTYGIHLCGIRIHTFAKCIPIAILLAGTVISRFSCEDRTARKETGLSITALAFSMLGDIAGDIEHLLGDASFLLMVAFFMVAQIFYALRANMRRDRDHYQVFLVSGLLLYAITLASVILQSIDSTVLTIAVTVYVIAIFSMGYFTFRSKTFRKWVPVLGASLFIISDSLIAVHAFVTPVPMRNYLVMGTYYAAQILLNWRYAV